MLLEWVSDNKNNFSSCAGDTNLPSSSGNMPIVIIVVVVWILIWVLVWVVVITLILTHTCSNL